jgi:uncharacterized protein YdaU (DUF1376 family)
MAEEWFPWYPDLYEADTLHLTAAQDGIYRRLIDWYMKKRRPLPNNPQALAAISRIGIDEWSANAETILAFFRPKGSELHHKRCNAELDKQDKMSSGRSEIAKKGAEARWSRTKEIDAGSMQKADVDHAPSMPEAMPKSMLGEHATLQDRTEQDSKKEPLPNGSVSVDQKKSSSPSFQTARISPTGEALPADDNPNDLGFDSPQDRFWRTAEALEARKIARSRCGQLLKFQSIDDATETLRAAGRARDPGRYLGKVIDNLRKEAQPAKNGSAASEPEWLADYRASGAHIAREGAMWRIGEGLYNEAGDQIGY